MNPVLGKVSAVNVFYIIEEIMNCQPAISQKKQKELMIEVLEIF